MACCSEHKVMPSAYGGVMIFWRVMFWYIGVVLFEKRFNLQQCQFDAERRKNTPFWVFHSFSSPSRIPRPYSPKRRFCSKTIENSDLSVVYCVGTPNHRRHASLTHTQAPFGRAWCVLGVFIEPKMLKNATIRYSVEWVTHSSRIGISESRTCCSGCIGYRSLVTWFSFSRPEITT